MILTCFTEVFISVGKGVPKRSGQDKTGVGGGVQVSGVNKYI